MYIKEIISQHRRDMHVIMACQHCGYEKETTDAYDDTFYHEQVVPNMTCNACGETAGTAYEARSTKYPDDIQI